jgi:hypothetical protein
LAGTGADANNDGWVSQNDYPMWRANFGRTSDLAPARADAAVGYWDVPGLRIVDFVTYGPQTNDDSQGRLPNGTGPLTFFATPTPDAANQAAGNSAVTLTDGVGQNASLVDDFLGFAETRSPTRHASRPLMDKSASHIDSDLLLLALESLADEHESPDSDSFMNDGVAAEELADASLIDLAIHTLGLN